MRTVVRSLIAGVLAGAVAGVAGPALAAPVTLAAPGVPASAEQAQHQQSARTVGAVASGLAVSIDSVSPQSVSSASSTVVVTGTITNHTGTPLQGVQVQLQTSSAWFTGRTQMDEFSSGEVIPPLNAVAGTSWPATATLHSRATMSWTASFPVASAGYTAYEVYPIEAQALSSGYTPLGDARTFLPYWPRSAVGAPHKLDIAWVWPLIDTPQQGACRDTLATNELASSLAPGGRLSGLLAAGLQYAASTQLTWAVDPALLSNATVMTRRYKVGGDAACTETTSMAASGAARTWLDRLRAGTTGEPMFVTPYADPDVSALTHSGLDQDISRAYAIGNSVARQALGGTFGPGSAIAWPADGSADASVLASLAGDGQVHTTILNSDEMPALPTSADPNPADTSVASVPSGIGTTMSVLLADSDISSDLAAASATASAGDQFSVEQEFLAETAMIVAEAPYSARSVVIAPPRRWDPSATEAAALLWLTTRAPWLRPVSLATLSSQHADPAPRKSLPGSKVAPRELSGDYMGNVSAVRSSAGVYRSMLYLPAAEVTTSLDAAVAATESSAWRGRASRGGWTTALRHLSSYLRHREGQVQIITGTKVVLGGTSGSTPVSVSNGLDDATVQVTVRALLPADSQISIEDADPPTVIHPGQTSIIRLSVHSAALGSTLVQLQLVTDNRTPLSWTTKSLSIESTRFGRALLIVIAAALGLLVLASLARWIRRWWRDGISGADGRSGGAG